MEELPGGEGASGDYMMEGDGEGSYGTAKISSMAGRGERVVSIRGVFPLKRQIDKIAKAMNVSPATLAQSMMRNNNNQFQGGEMPMGGTPMESMPMGSDAFSGGDSGMMRNTTPASTGPVDLVDFEVQRKTAVKGDDPWAGPWVDVDIEVALKVLNETLDFDPDPVDVGVTDPVITSPLPGRVARPWGTLATHPRIKDFVLPQSELDKVNAQNKALLEYNEKVKALQPGADKKGFGGVQPNLGQIRNNILNGNSGDASRYLNEINSTFDPEAARRGNVGGTVNQLKRRAGASGHLLLFRYFDFSVIPGNAYRYRVRLVINNPSFGLPPETVMDDVDEGKTRFTKWSKPTAPVIVQEDSNYFLTKVDYPVSSASTPAARLNMYHWYPDVGTTVNTVVEAHLGEVVGGLTKAEVLDPASQTFEEQEITLQSNDLLIDIADAPLVSQTDHPDLGLSTRSRLRGSLGLNDQVLVVNKYGELVALDPVTDQPKAASLAQNYQAWADHYKWIKELAEQKGTGDDLTDGLYPGTDGMGTDGMGTDSGMGRSRTRNPARRRSGRGAGAGAP